jgi:hypothetical protein
VSVFVGLEGPEGRCRLIREEPTPSPVRVLSVSSVAHGRIEKAEVPTIPRVGYLRDTFNTLQLLSISNHLHRLRVDTFPSPKFQRSFSFITNPLPTSAILSKQRMKPLGALLTPAMQWNWLVSLLWIPTDPTRARRANPCFFIVWVRRSALGRRISRIRRREVR